MEMSAREPLDAIISSGLCRWLRMFRIAKHALKRCAQRCVRIVHRHRQTEINQRVTPNCGPEIPHGVMPEKCSKSGSTLKAMPWKLTHLRKRTPMAAILSSRDQPGPLRSTQTPTRPSRISPLTLKSIERADDPALEIGNELGHVAAALAQIEHHVRHALAWPVIGELAAAPGLKHRKAIGVEQIDSAWR